MTQEQWRLLIAEKKMTGPDVSKEDRYGPQKMIPAAAEEAPSPLILSPQTVLASPQPPPTTEEENPFALTDDGQTAIDVTDKLSTFDRECEENNGAKAILRETLGVTALQIQGDYAWTLEQKYNYRSKTKEFNRRLAAWLYVHSMGYKGQRAGQAFEAVKAINTQDFMQGNITENGKPSKKSRLLGR